MLLKLTIDFVFLNDSLKLNNHGLIEDSRKKKLIVFM